MLKTLAIVATVLAALSFWGAWMVNRAEGPDKAMAAMVTGCLMSVVAAVCWYFA